MGDLLGSPRVAPLFYFFSLHNSPLSCFSSPFHSYFAVLSYQIFGFQKSNIKETTKNRFWFSLNYFDFLSLSCVFFYFLIVSSHFSTFRFLFFFLSHLFQEFRTFFPSLKGIKYYFSLYLFDFSFFLLKIISEYSNNPPSTSIFIFMMPH